MLYNVLVSAVQLCILYLYPVFFISFPFRSPQSPSRVPQAAQAVLTVLYYCIYVSPKLSILSPTLFPLGVHMFVLYVYASVSALQISSSTSFF